MLGVPGRSDGVQLLLGAQARLHMADPQRSAYSRGIRSIVPCIAFQMVLARRETYQISLPPARSETPTAAFSITLVDMFGNTNKVCAW